MKYSASLFFSSDARTAGDALWEEIIILIEAENENNAKMKAEAIGSKRKLSYIAETKVVTWKFERVERVCFIEDELIDGVELFSRFLKGSEAISILTQFD